MIIAYKHKTEVLKPILEVTSVIDKIGVVWYSVQFQDNDNRLVYYRFKNMSSVIDFINSNIK